MTETYIPPMRDVSRDDPFAPQDRECPICGRQYSSRRARYCSGACRMRALRRRRHYAALTPTAPTSPAQLEWPSVYECPLCKRRRVGDHECNRFGQRLGLGGLCPHCNRPVLITDLVAGPAET